MKWVKLKKNMVIIFYLRQILALFSKVGLNKAIKQAKKTKPYKPKIKTFVKNYNDYLEFKSFIKKLALSVNEKIIIRPHPGDMYHATWYKDFKDSKNIKIVYDNDISPWIIGSLGLIHRGCTTAVQAYFNKIPIYYWQSKQKLQKKDKLISYQISNKFSTVEHFLNLINKKQKKNIRFKKTLLSKEIYIPKKMTSCQLIIKNMKKSEDKRREKI